MLGHERSTSTGAMPVLVRDVVRGIERQVPGDTPMRRVPYDLLNPVGPVHIRDDELIEYLQDDEIRTGRSVEGFLREARPGERVLLRLPPNVEGAWWLCEVLEVGGIAAE